MKCRHDTGLGRRLSAAALICALLAGCLPFPGAAAQETGWTVLVYMIGSNLESSDILESGGNATGDLQEMLGSVRDDTELLVMTGGAGRWWGGTQGIPEIPADRCCLWRVSAGGIQSLWEGQGSMGDPETLCTLLDRLPAESGGRTALIFWNHGYGPLEGFGNDETSGDKRLTLPEIVSAFESRGISGRPFSLIGFDACLMSSCETAAALSPYAGYLVASEDIEPAEGWGYGFLQTLSGAAAAEDAGREIIRRYQERNQARKDAYGLALIDLKRAAALNAAVDVLFGVLEKRLETGAFPAVSELRTGSWDYARTTAGTEYDLVDLYELVDQSGAGQEVLSLFPECVLDYRGNRERSHGLSVFFPHKADSRQRQDWQAVLETLSPGENRLSFIRSYEKQLLEGTKTAAEAAETAERPYSVRLTAGQLRDFSSARYAVLEENTEGSMRIVYAGNNCVLEGDSLRADYPGTVLWFRSGGDRIPIVSIFCQEDSGGAYYQTSAILFQYRDSGFSRQINVNLQIARDKAEQKWSILSVCPLDGSKA